MHLKSILFVLGKSTAYIFIIIYFSLCLKTLSRVVKHGSLLLYSGGMKLLDSSDYSSYRMPLFINLLNNSTKALLAVYENVPTEWSNISR